MRHPTVTASLLLFLSAPLARADYLVTGHDTVTTVDHPVAVTAKFERKLIGYLRPDVTNAEVRFEAGDRRWGAVTDDDGVAAVTLALPGPGVHAFTAVLGRDEEARATSRVWVLEPATPVVVVDIDGTLSDWPDLRVPLDGEKAPTFPGAQDTISALAERHQIVYLTARDDAFDRKTRTFLRRHGFPEGPVLYNDMGLDRREERQQLDPKHHGRFKLAALAALKARGLNLVLGIGNAETDAFAYEGARIPSMILTSKPGQGPSFRFQRYAELRARLEQLGFLPRREEGDATRGLAQGLGE